MMAESGIDSEEWHEVWHQRELMAAINKFESLDGFFFSLSLFLFFVILSVFSGHHSTAQLHFAFRIATHLAFSTPFLFFLF